MIQSNKYLHITYYTLQLYSLSVKLIKRNSLTNDILFQVSFRKDEICSQEYHLSCDDKQDDTTE